MAQNQRTTATWTILSSCEWLTRSVPVRMNFLEQFDHRRGCKLDTRQVIEPDSRAAKAQIHAHETLIVVLELLPLHRLSAARTGDRRGGIHVESRLSHPPQNRGRCRL